MTYIILYLLIGLILTALVKLMRFYEFNKLQLFFIGIGWPWFLFSIVFFSLVGIGENE